MGVQLRHIRKYTGVLLLTVLWLSALPVQRPADASEVQTHYLYSLSNFDGKIASSWARIAIDRYRNEVYLMDREMVRVFDENGMEIYRFGEDGSLGVVMDVAVLQSGDILALCRNGSEQAIWVCDFRGIPLRKLKLTGFAGSYAGFVPSLMVLRDHRLYLASNETFRLAVTDETGRFQKGYDLVELLELEESKRSITQIGGLSVDAVGNILFTVPVNFSIHALSPDGEIKTYAQPGGAPGKFNLVSGIVSDAQGYYYVADRLKDVVEIFDSNFTFIRQFGYRGFRTDNLSGPRYLAVDSRNRLLVSQVNGKGVSVFQIQHDN